VNVIAIADVHVVDRHRANLGDLDTSLLVGNMRSPDVVVGDLRTERDPRGAGLFSERLKRCGRAAIPPRGLGFQVVLHTRLLDG
jgi:hypothetical protein